MIKSKMWRLAIAGIFFTSFANASDFFDLGGAEIGKIDASRIAEFFNSVKAGGAEPTATKAGMPELESRSLFTKEEMAAPEPQPVVKKAIESELKKDVASITSNAPQQAASSFSKKPSDLYYLKNIPSLSKLIFNEPVTLLPREAQIHFEGGKRVYAEPLSKPALMSFCTVKFAPSGLGRSIKSLRDYEISNVSSKMESYKVEGLGLITKHELYFTIADKHIKSVYCMSTLKGTDMNVSDFRVITGDNLGIELRKYLEI